MLAMAVCVLLGPGDALRRHDSDGGGQPAPGGDLGRAAQEWLQKQFRPPAQGATAEEARGAASPIVDAAKRAQEWIQGLERIHDFKLQAQGDKPADEKTGQRLTDMGQKVLEEWMRNPAKPIPQGGKGAAEKGASWTGDFGKKAQEWLQDQARNLFRAAQSQQEVAKNASPPQPAKAQQAPMSDTALPAPPQLPLVQRASPAPVTAAVPHVPPQPAAAQRAPPPPTPVAARPPHAVARMPAEAPLAAAAESVKRVLMPDDVKFLNKANAAGFSANILAKKRLPRSQGAAYLLGSHAGVFKPKAGVVGVAGATVATDGSAETGSVGVLYSQSSKPVYVRAGAFVPARTAKGKAVAKAMSSGLSGSPAESSSSARFGKESDESA